MKSVLGIILILAGICLGAYVGGWLFFVGGIVQIIEQIQHPPVDAVIIALGILKVIMSGAAAGLSTMILVTPGIKILKD